MEKLDKQAIAPLGGQSLVVGPPQSRLKEGWGKGELHIPLLIRTQRALEGGSLEDLTHQKMAECEHNCITTNTPD